MAYVDWVTQFGVTTSATDVTITAGMEIEISSNVTCRKLTINAPGGKLKFKTDTSAELSAYHNIVVFGELIMIPVSFAVNHTITFEGISNAATVGGGEDVMDSDIGLWVRPDGVLTIDGPYRKAWTRLAASEAAGQTVLTMEAAPTGWQIGDTIVVCPTDPITVNTKNQEWWQRFDERTISNVSGNDVTITAGLTYAHNTVDIGGGITMYPEVLNLTRNAMIRGRLDGNGSLGGQAHVHLMMHSDTPNPTSIKQLRLDRMGPRRAPGEAGSVLGRYPLHFHHGHDATRGILIDSVVSTRSRNRAFVSHLSDEITWRGCIAYDTVDTPYWWDLNDESDDNFYDRCVAALVRASPFHQGNGMAGFDLRPGIGNHCEGCIAVGIQGNGNASGFHWPGGTPGNRVWEPFIDNVSHNNKVDALFTWQNDKQYHLVNRFIGYHCAEAGIEHGAYNNNFEYRNIHIYGCSVGVGIHSHSSIQGRAIFRNVHVYGGGVMSKPFLLFRHGQDVTSDKTLIDQCYVEGYSQYGIGGGNYDPTGEFGSAQGTHEWLQVQHTTFDPPGDQPDFLYIAPHPLSVISVDNGGQAFELRRFDQTGTLVPEWNARRTDVTSFATAAPSAFEPVVVPFLANAPEGAPDPPPPPPDPDPVIVTVTTAPLGGDSLWLTVPNVTLTAAGTPTGAVVEYQANNSGVWVTYTAPVVITAEGAHHYQFRATFAAETSEVVAHGFQLDRTPPISAVSVATGTTVATITITAADPNPNSVNLVSEVAFIEYNLDSEGYVEYTEPFQVDVAESHTLAWRAEDAAGNLEAEQSVTIPAGGVTFKPARRRRRRRH